MIIPFLHAITHDGSMYAAKYGNMDPINRPPVMLAYIPYMDPMGMRLFTG